MSFATAYYKNLLTLLQLSSHAVHGRQALRRGAARLVVSPGDPRPALRELQRAGAEFCLLCSEPRSLEPERFQVKGLGLLC